jgi:hypothetical protein
MRYGLPGTEAEIHYAGSAATTVRGYGLPGTEAEIHYSPRKRLIFGGKRLL